MDFLSWVLLIGMLINANIFLSSFMNLGSCGNPTDRSRDLRIIILTFLLECYYLIITILKTINFINEVFYILILGTSGLILIIEIIYVLMNHYICFSFFELIFELIVDTISFIYNRFTLIVNINNKNSKFEVIESNNEVQDSSYSLVLKNKTIAKINIYGIDDNYENYIYFREHIFDYRASKRVILKEESNYYIPKKNKNKIYNIFIEKVKEDITKKYGEKAFIIEISSYK